MSAFARVYTFFGSREAADNACARWVGDQPSK